MRFTELSAAVTDTLAKEPLDAELVITACDRLSGMLRAGELREQFYRNAEAIPFLHGLRGADLDRLLEEVSQMMSRCQLEKRLETELGGAISRGGGAVRRFPLGVLLHIGAGNLSGLPAYSVIEGLLTGNINLLKLPGSEKEISLMLLRALIRIEPALKPYIYVFDIPSSQTNRLEKLASLADGIVVWGGDEAVSAVRRLAPPGTKLIEWGHKTSFAYITEKGMREELLAGLAKHMLQTRQALCSSCQLIFLDAEEPRELENFCGKFEKILGVVKNAGTTVDWDELGAAAQESLYRYHRELERLTGAVSEDAASAESIYQVGGYRVELLPREQIMMRLRKAERCLQTVGLLCGEEEREELSFLFLRAGANRIRDGAAMSELTEGEAHDGEYPLLRYTKVVSETPCHSGAGSA